MEAAVAAAAGTGVIPGDEEVVAEKVEEAVAIPTKESLLVAISAGLGYGFDAYAVNIFGLIIPFLVVSLHTSTKTLGNVGSLQLLGYTIGTIGFGWAADRWGRKDTLGVSILSYGVTTAVGGLFTAVGPFAAMRFLTGIGGAGELAVGAPYTAEVWPKRHRALGAGGIIFSIYSLGYILAAVVALFVVSTIGWQWAFYLAVVPALAVFLVRRRIVESPRYLHAVAEARRRSQMEQASEAARGGREPLRHIWSTRESRKRVVVGSLIYIANACGYWAIAVFLTDFIVKKFHESPRQAIVWAIVFYGVQFFLSFAGSLLADWIGRRPAAILGSVIMIVCTVVGAEAGSLVLFLVFMGTAVGML
ncbi:MAG TPA: MFS transporter, partial [Acidimicrobiales bacterium]|nr:MFS transporter [Acidimicrobiales bacterium]